MEVVEINGLSVSHSVLGDMFSNSRDVNFAKQVLKNSNIRPVYVLSDNKKFGARTVRLGYFEKDRGLVEGLQDQEISLRKRDFALAKVVEGTG
jgi:hypothetical protein